MILHTKKHALYTDMSKYSDYRPFHQIVHYLPNSAFGLGEFD